MEATATTTGSKTIADLVSRAAAEHGQRPAVRYKKDGSWHDVSYVELAQIVDGFVATASSVAAGSRRIARVDLARAVADALDSAERSLPPGQRRLAWTRKGAVPRIESDPKAIQFLLRSLFRAALANLSECVLVEVQHDPEADVVGVTCRGQPGPFDGKAMASCRGHAAALGVRLEATSEAAHTELSLLFPRRYFPLPR